MKLWLISQTENNNYDTFDSAVVAADTEEEAKAVPPNVPFNDNPPKWDEYVWASSPAKVTAEYIGEAKPGTPAGTVICSSFNAG